MPLSTKDIKHWMRKVDASRLSVDSFFAQHDVPFSRAQYFRYKKLLDEHFEYRVPPMRGGNRKLGEREEIFLRALALSDSLPAVGALHSMIKSELGTNVGPAAIRRALDRLFPDRERPGVGRPCKHGPTTSINSLGGFELIIALAYDLKWPERVAKMIAHAVRDRSRGLGGKRRTRRDMKGRGKGGRFTSAYNARADVCARRFASVSDKRIGKNWESMNVMHDGAAVVARKCLALLSLPAVTGNGAVRTVDLTLGQMLEHLCGFNYKQATINKFLSELKYLGIADRLLHDLPLFWQECWGEDVSKMAGPIVCYYVDGNTKPVWSSQRVKQNKVTMLGRVMGCLEAVFVHDGLGHPVYFETYSGHAPVGEYVLGMFEKIEASILDVPGSQTSVCRAIVMDAASNSVKTLRAFAAQEKYHYITTLDDNQWSERKTCTRSYPVRYRHGDATLRDVDIELADSQDNKYLVVSRAIKISWDNGKETVLITSVPKLMVDASEIVHAYFRRWPAQELIFRRQKAAVSLHRVCGYGRKRVINERVRAELEELRAKRERLEAALVEPMAEIVEHDQVLARLIPQESRLRQKTSIRNGIRFVPAAIRTRFEEIGIKIKRYENAKKRIEKDHAKAFRAYRKTMREWFRLQHKTTVYQLDVELDQILTYYRASLAHLCAYFIEHFLDHALLLGLAQVDRLMRRGPYRGKGQAQFAGDRLSIQGRRGRTARPIVMEELIQTKLQLMLQL